MNLSDKPTLDSRQGEIVDLRDLNDFERHLLGVCVDRYIDDLRAACQEDQGLPDGRPGTIGHNLQRELRALKERVA